MKPLPLPVRLAAGLVATAVEQARDLPRLVVEFPVTAVSQALQASMRVQQRVTELAIKGDLALGSLRPVEDKPSWATFDDDEPPNPVTELRPQRTAPRPTPDAAEPTPVAKPVTVQPITVQTDGGRSRTATPKSAAPKPATPKPAAPKPAAASEPAPLKPPAVEPPVDDGPVAPSTASPAQALAAEPTSDGPQALPGYAELTIPQLRGRLRALSLADLRSVLAWEESHGNRPPYVTMLANRITTVTEA